MVQTEIWGLADVVMNVRREVSRMAVRREPNCFQQLLMLVMDWKEHSFDPQIFHQLMGETLFVVLSEIREGKEKDICKHGDWGDTQIYLYEHLWKVLSPDGYFISPERVDDDLEAAFWRQSGA